MINSKRRTGQFVTWALVVALVAAGVRAGERQSGKSAAGELGRQRKRLLAELIEKKDSPGECHDLLKRRLLEGHLRDVKAGLELRDEDDRRIFEGYRFAQLRALCARAIFRRYSFRTAQLGWPSEEQGARLRQLARETTAAYEERPSSLPLPISSGLACTPGGMKRTWGDDSRRTHFCFAGVHPWNPRASRSIRFSRHRCHGCVRRPRTLSVSPRRTGNLLKRMRSRCFSTS
ncbi:MAG: hypothetical protein ACYSWQ_30290 [Planctomycetota bacterium]